MLEKTPATPLHNADNIDHWKKITHQIYSPKKGTSTWPLKTVATWPLKSVAKRSPLCAQNLQITGNPHRLSAAQKPDFFKADLQDRNASVFSDPGYARWFRLISRIFISHTLHGMWRTTLGWAPPETSLEVAGAHHSEALIQALVPSSRSDRSWDPAGKSPFWGCYQTLYSNHIKSFWNSLLISDIKTFLQIYRQLSIYDFSWKILAIIIFLNQFSLKICKFM